jgi:hypothetical protein
MAKGLLITPDGKLAIQNGGLRIGEAGDPCCCYRCCDTMFGTCPPILDIRGGPTGGTFKLNVTHSGITETTAALNYDTDAATIQSAIEALSHILPGQVAVTGTNPTFRISYASELGCVVTGTFQVSLTGGTDPRIVLQTWPDEITVVVSGVQTDCGCLVTAASQEWVGDPNGTYVMSYLWTAAPNEDAFSGFWCMVKTDGPQLNRYSSGDCTGTPTIDTHYIWFLNAFGEGFSISDGFFASTTACSTSMGITRGRTFYFDNEEPICIRSGMTVTNLCYECGSPPDFPIPIVGTTHGYGGSLTLSWTCP